MVLALIGGLGLIVEEFEVVCSLVPFAYVFVLPWSWFLLLCFLDRRLKSVLTGPVGFPLWWSCWLELLLGLLFSLACQI